MRTRKPEADRVPYEGASAAAIRSLRGHLELEEIEAAQVVARSPEVATSPTGGLQPRPRRELRSGRAPGTGWAGSGDPRRTADRFVRKNRE